MGSEGVEATKLPEDELFAVGKAVRPRKGKLKETEVGEKGFFSYAEKQSQIFPGSCEESTSFL